jgi:hypothetical protein
VIPPSLKDLAPVPPNTSPISRRATITSPPRLVCFLFLFSYGINSYSLVQHKSRSLQDVQSVKEQHQRDNEGFKVVCRICEEEISLSLLKEHSKFCAIANTWDMIALADEQQLAKASFFIPVPNR